MNNEDLNIEDRYNQYNQTNINDINTALGNLYLYKTFDVKHIKNKIWEIVILINFINLLYIITAFQKYRR